MQKLIASFYPYQGTMFQREVPIMSSLYKGPATPAIVLVGQIYYIRVDNYPVYKECESPYAIGKE